MTVRHIIESIKQAVPGVSDTQVLLELNEIYKSFVRETKVMRDYFTITPTTNTVTYDFDDDELNLVYEVAFYNSSGVELTGEDTLSYYIKDKTITFGSYYKSTITSIPSTIATIRLNSYAMPNSFTLDNDTQEPEFPEDFHGALISGVLKELFARIPSIEVRMPDGSVRFERDFKSATYHEGRYARYVKDAIKYSNKYGDDTPAEVRYHPLG
jgi:hypothetical protein